jgi:hypothetical protein
MTDYFDSCLFIDTVSFAKVEQVVKMVFFTTRIHFETGDKEKSLPFYFCGGIAQFGLWQPRFAVSSSRKIRHTQTHTR